MPGKTLILQFMLLSACCGAGTHPINTPLILSGSIVETACSVALSAQSQIVEFPDVSEADFAADGGLVRPLAITLENCAAQRLAAQSSLWHYVDVRFVPVPTADDGVCLKVLNADGSPVPFRKWTQGGQIVEGTTQLNYLLRLSPCGHAPEPGHYRRSVRFDISYQ